MEKYDRSCEYFYLFWCISYSNNNTSSIFYLFSFGCFFYLPEDFSNYRLEYQEKAPYVEKAEKRKSEYNKKMQAYNLKLVKQ